MSENIDFKCAPVLLIGFNRPDRLAAQVERVRAVKPSRLFIAVDGPRADCVGRSRAEMPCASRVGRLDCSVGTLGGTSASVFV